MNGWVGQTLGKVRIDSLLAKGGMAEVYIGTHTTLQREVAVKVLRNNYDEHPHALERFQREAMVVGKLRHPNIVQVFDFDTVNSHPFLVMEYIRGPSLLKYLNSQHDQGRRLEFEHVVRLMNAMISALQYAHESGVVHRDIKPGNILLTSRSSEIQLGKHLPEDFEPVLTDFGLVRFIDSTQHTTGSGQIAGTPAYMSPEQARGDLTDGRTDVYSLGIVLYEMLAGHLPFEGETTMGVLMKHINEPPPPIEGLPTAMQYVLDRALAKDVDDRFQTPVEFGEAFTKAVQDKADYSTLDVLTSHKPARKPARNLFTRSKPRWIRAALALLTVLVVTASFLLSRVLPLGAVATQTPTRESSPTQLQPSSTATSTETPMPVVLLGRTGVLHIQDGSATADQAALMAVALLAPPTGSQYEVWLVNEEERLSLGILTLDGSGQGELVFTRQEGTNLIANYRGVELTVESSPDDDPESSGVVAYSFYLPEAGLTNLRYILSSFPNTPDQNPLIQGLNTNIQTLDELAKEMQRASANGNTDRVLLYAEAILNILVGEESPNHKDWTEDGQVDDPSDGYGLVLNGRNLGYLQALYIEANAAVNSAGASQPMTTHGENLMTSVQNLAQWTQQLQELITAILASPPDMDQKVTQIAALTDKMLNGIDLDEDGLIEPVPGEAGALIAYEQAYRMADMPLVAVGIVNIGTGTPTFIFTPATASVGGGTGGSSASTPAPTDRVPPGQTRIPPGQEKKTPNSPNNDNNGNNGGGNNNGNNGGGTNNGNNP